MLVPLTREKFEQLVPLIATGAQYGCVWGKWSDFLRRIIISVVGVIIIWLVSNFLGEALDALKLILAAIIALYWLWVPVYLASIKNSAYRRLPYSGFWRGRVLDVFVTEELVSEEQTVNDQGELVIIENRERRINLEVGDKNGFRELIQAPLKRIHKNLKPGQAAEMVVLSKQPDLGRIARVTDVYIPSQDLWVGEYPYLQRNIFLQVSQELKDRYGYSSEKRSQRYAASKRRRRFNN